METLVGGWTKEFRNNFVYWFTQSCLDFKNCNSSLISLVFSLVCVTDCKIGRVHVLYLNRDCNHENIIA